MRELALIVDALRDAHKMAASKPKKKPDGGLNSRRENGSTIVGSEIGCVGPVSGRMSIQYCQI